MADGNLQPFAKRNLYQVLSRWRWLRMKYFGPSAK